MKFVIPAKAGMRLFQEVLDPGFRRGDDPKDFLRDHQYSLQGNYFLLINRLIWAIAKWRQEGPAALVICKAPCKLERITIA